MNAELQRGAVHYRGDRLPDGVARTVQVPVQSRYPAVGRRGTGMPSSGLPLWFRLRVIFRTGDVAVVNWSSCAIAWTRNTSSASGIPHVGGAPLRRRHIRVAIVVLGRQDNQTERPEIDISGAGRVIIGPGPRSGAASGEFRDE